VRWYKDDKGHGRITGDDGEVLFVHFSQHHRRGLSVAEADQRVSFVWNGGTAAHGRYNAANVRVER
jgi:cold shock CspA family protein